MKTVDILGVPFTYTDQTAFISTLDKYISDQQRSFIVTANPEIVMKAKNDSGFMEIIKKATHIVADGIGIVKAAQLLRTPLPGRVTGYDTMIGLLAVANEKKYSIYLLGAEKETLQKAVETIQSDYPNISIAGSHDGYFDWENNTISEEVIKLQPDIVFVALGVPKQEQWIAEHLSSFTSGLFIGVGGSIDVIAGTVKRAPIFWQRLNLEWFYRLLKQPSRWKRMMALPLFAFQILKRKVRGSPS